jgi:hypothetical protein
MIYVFLSWFIIALLLLPIGIYKWSVCIFIEGLWSIGVLFYVYYKIRTENDEEKSLLLVPDERDQRARAQPELSYLTSVQVV